MNNKFGQSVLEQKDIESEEILGDIKVSDDELATMRKELKESAPSGKVTSNVCIDAVNGIKSETIVDDDTSIEDLVNTIEGNDISGKTITRTGIELIRQLTGEEPTDDTKLSIAKFCELHVIDDLNNMSMVEEAFGEKISKAIEAITSSKADYEKVYTRFATQIYNSYIKVVNTANDLKALASLSKELDTLNKDKDETKSNPETMDVNNLNNIQEVMSKFLDSVKNLDSRNSKLRQDFSIDDIDTRIVEDVKICLDTALKYTKCYNKIGLTAARMKKEFKSTQETNSSIDNWINDIKTDPDTLYTFPVNDFLTTAATREELINYIRTSIMMITCIKSANSADILAEMEASGDAAKFLLDRNLITKKDLDKYGTQARLIVYVFSRTFKVKSTNNISERRILSYTLDMISKLAVEDYQEPFIKLCNYAYKAIIGE